MKQKITVSYNQRFFSNTCSIDNGWSSYQ